MHPSRLEPVFTVTSYAWFLGSVHVRGPVRVAPESSDPTSRSKRFSQPMLCAAVSAEARAWSGNVTTRLWYRPLQVGPVGTRQ